MAQVELAKSDNKEAGSGPRSASRRQHPLWQVLTRRESATIFVGALLLVLAFGSLVAATFLGLVEAGVIVNAFTLLLGYFFGHVAK